MPAVQEGGDVLIIIANADDPEAVRDAVVEALDTALGRRASFDEAVRGG